MLNWIKYGAVVFTLVAVYSLYVSQINKAKEEVHKEYQMKIAEIEKQSIEAQGELLLSALQVEQEKNETIERITRDADAVIRSLHNRPIRPSETNTTASVESSCTGRELYKEDGEFLVREAARADKILEERNYWFAQYENARKKLKEQNSE